MPKPTIPSPDALIVEGVDRLLAIPQRRGVPLPAVLVPLAYAGPLGMLAFAFGLAASGGGGLSLIWAGLACLDAAIATGPARTCLADSRSWTPGKAQSYRANALRMRETRVFPRMLDVAMVTIGAVTLLNVLLLPGPPSLVAVATMFVLWTAGQGLRNYADCAMPHDPDLTHRVPAASSA